MLHWLQLVSLANSAPAVQQQSIASLVQKEVATQLLGCGVDRSRSNRDRPMGNTRRQGNKRLRLTGPQQLALPSSSSAAPAPNSNPKSKGRGRRPGRRPLPGKVWTLNGLLAGGDEVASMLFRNEGNGVCVLSFPRRHLSVGSVHALPCLYWLWWSSWIQSVPVFAEQARCSPLNSRLPAY